VDLGFIERYLCSEFTGCNFSNASKSMASIPDTSLIPPFQIVPGGIVASELKLRCEYCYSKSGSLSHYNSHGWIL
jgi:hypothetical protein